MNGSYASYNVIVKEILNVKIKYAIYPKIYTSIHYGI